MESELARVCVTKILQYVQCDLQRNFTHSYHLVDTLTPLRHKFGRHGPKGHEVADDDARLYNARESLFGKPVTDYSQLKEIQKKFEPYGAMWESVDSWLKHHRAWLTDPFADLDAESVESSAQTILRTLKKCEKRRSRVVKRSVLQSTP